MNICRRGVSSVSQSTHSNATGAGAIRGGLTRVDANAVKPTSSSSLTFEAKRSPQRCICRAIGSPARCTTKSFSRGMFTAVSFSALSASRLMPMVTMGGSSPSMLNIGNGAAFTVPSAPSVVASTIGRGAIRLAISLWHGYSVLEDANLKLGSVPSDVLGGSGRAILKAIALPDRS